MDRYLDPHQARRHVPTQYESLLGDAIERAYAAGTHDLAGLVAYLNRTGPARKRASCGRRRSTRRRSPAWPKRNNIT